MSLCRRPSVFFPLNVNLSGTALQSGFGPRRSVPSSHRPSEIKDFVSLPRNCLGERLYLAVGKNWN